MEEDFGSQFNAEQWDKEGEAATERLQQRFDAGIPGAEAPMPSIDVPDVGGQLTDAVQNASDNASEAINNASENIQEGLPGAIENLQTQLGAFMRGRSVEEEAAWRQSEQEKWAAKTDPNAPGQEFQGEGGRAVVGGTLDAVESIGDFAELTGDTIKTKFNETFGRPVDPTQNPFDTAHYVRGDANWLEVPDSWAPENKTALGKLSRGFVEFGVLLATTRGAGKLAVGSRAAGVGAAGNKYIQFVKTAGTVAAEGAAAELIMDDEANLMNLVDEHAKFLSPTVKKILGVDALKVNPDDNIYLAKLKVLVTGAGFNLVAHTIGAFAKAKWAAKKAMKDGFNADAANEIGNQAFQDEWLRSRQLDEVASTEMAADSLEQGKGIPLNEPREDYILNKLDNTEAEEWISPNALPERKAQLEQVADQRGAQQLDIFDFDADQSPSQAAKTPDPFVNPRKFMDSERATVRPDIEGTPRDFLKKNLREAVEDLADGGEGRSYSPLMTEAALKRISRGDKNVREWVLEIAEDISDTAFKDLDDTLDQKAVQRLAIIQAAELDSLIEGAGPRATKKLQEHFKTGDNGIVWMHDGNQVVTGNAAQKIGLQLLINTKMKTASAIAKGALSIADDLPINRQVEMMMDQVKVALIEHKKIGYMTGSELAAHKGFYLSPKRRKQIQGRLSDIEKEQEELFENMSKAYLSGNEGAMDDLWELYALSDGNVRAMDHIHEFLKSKLRGGDMGKGPIRGEFRQQLASTFYNSILSALKTPIDAITSTTMIATSRPAMQWVGGAIKLDRKQMAIAHSGMEAIAHGWKESIEMAKYNWDLSLQRKSQTYTGRYDAGGDFQKWKAMATFYEKYGDPVQKRAYRTLDTVVKFNNSPWAKYSANAMGAGDALARTLIGRMNMRMLATKEAIEKGVDLNDARALSRKTEQNYRRKIFKKNGDGMWVVHDEATMLAGDETTMTKALEGYLQVFEQIQRVPGARVLFPFVRTGVNALDLTFQHSPAGIFHAKYRHLKKGIHLDKYGITPENLASEIALMEGRIAVGTAITGLATYATMNGFMTGDYPYNKIDRDLWIARGIKPYSFKFGNIYVSYEELEPFNTVFSVAANLAQNSHIFGEDVIDHWNEKIIFMTSALLVDKSMLSGVKDLATLMNPQQGGAQAARTFSKFARSHLPYASLLGELGTITDANRKEANTFLEMMWERDLVWKSMMHPKYDILAGSKKAAPLNYEADTPWMRAFNAASPIGITYVEDDPVKQALVDIRYNLPDQMKHVNGIVLNSFMKSELSKYMSMDVKFRKELEGIIKSPKWKTALQEYKDKGFLEREGDYLRNQAFYHPINNAFKRAKTRAWTQVLFNNPELANDIKIRKVKANLGKAGRYGDLEQLNKHGK
tara:strand:- start:181 stop:4338 length:4158 start_codon:yes stop_codon:yes gene_type:complete